MYAVIRAGGKQFKVAKGDVIRIERVKGDTERVEFKPLLVVDDDGTSHAGRSELAGASVGARVVGDVKGDKIDVYKFRSKTGYRRHTGHRQRYTTIEISEIDLGGSRSSVEETSDGS